MYIALAIFGHGFIKQFKSFAKSVDELLRLSDAVRVEDDNKKKKIEKLNENCWLKSMRDTKAWRRPNNQTMSI